MKRWVLCLLLIATLAAFAAPVNAIDCTFMNPLLPLGQDPSVVYHDGYYYLVQSSGGLNITKSETLSGLGRAESVQVWSPPPGEPYSYDLWGPELIYLDGHWYIYVAAVDSPGHNAAHRMYVLQADTDDPLGTWTVKGRVYDPESDKWAIDGVPFEYNDQLYFVWSGWPGDRGDFPQNLYIAEMSDPLTISGPRHLISEPDQAWERTEAAINEGPEPYIHNGVLSIVYSADASWMPAYKLAVLTLTGDNPLERESWTKTGPLFEQMPDAVTPLFGPGHSSMPVQSPDGSEEWFLYHAQPTIDAGWQGRDVRAQEFQWSAENTPILGEPIPAGVAQPAPSGEPCGLVASFEEAEFPAPTSAPDGAGDYIDLGESLVSTMNSFSVAALVEVQDTGGPYAFASQEGGLSSNFVLGQAEGKFTFTMYDSLGQSPVSVTAQYNPVVGQSYFLVGVYDAAQHEIALYVDGELQGTAPFTQAWEAKANTLVGAALHRGQRADVFNGGVLAVEFYNGALDAREVETLTDEIMDMEAAA
jgi:GH43 family beta-xylosidase